MSQFRCDKCEGHACGACPDYPWAKPLLDSMKQEADGMRRRDQRPMPLDADTQGHYIEVCKKWYEHHIKVTCDCIEKGQWNQAALQSDCGTSALRLIDRINSNNITRDDIDCLDGWEQSLDEIYG